MNYREATDYIEKLQTEVGSDLSLKQIKYLADKVGNPENKSRIIHIAGTNGKGSVGNCRNFSHVGIHRRKICFPCII